MKKFAISMLSAAFILGAANSVAAAEMQEDHGVCNFGKMKAHLQEKHPGLTIPELVKKYEHCHGTNGAEPSKNFEMMKDCKMMM